MGHPLPGSKPFDWVQGGWPDLASVELSSKRSLETRLRTPSRDKCSLPSLSFLPPVGSRRRVEEKRKVHGEQRSVWGLWATLRQRASSWPLFPNRRPEREEGSKTQPRGERPKPAKLPAIPASEDAERGVGKTLLVAFCNLFSTQAQPQITLVPGWRIEVHLP